MSEEKRKHTKKTVLYAGDSLGRANTAMQIHAVMMSKLFTSLGYEVIFSSQTGWYPGMDKEVDYIVLGERFHCFYSETVSLPNRRIRNLYRKFHQLTGINHWKSIKQLCMRFNPSIIVYYGYVCVRHLTSYSRKNRVPLLVERVDWFSPDMYTDLYNRCIWSWFTNRCIEKWTFKASGVIAISAFFYEYYRNHLPAVQIPALCCLEKSNTIRKKRKDDPLRIVYAGSPWKKDYLMPVIDAVLDLNKNCHRIEFDVIGVSSIDSVYADKYVENGIKFYGRVSHEKANEFVRNADCSILLRDDKRYAKAGFSTKLVESMWQGVPVICTAVGGTDSCIKDRVNGFLVKDNSVSTIKGTLDEILEMDDDRLNSIKKSAAEFAKDNFDYRNYIEIMRDFLALVMCDRQERDS